VTTVGLLGSGPAIAAVRAALEETQARPTETAIDDLPRADVAVVAAAVDGMLLDGAGAIARESGTPLVTIELGGIGGTPVAGVNAAVSGFAPETGCYDCLCHRVEAAAPEPGTSDLEAGTARFAGAIAGHELATLVTGGQSSVIGGTIEIPHAERRVLPVPFCSCADPNRDRSGLRRTHEERSLDEALSAAERAFDERVGPITNLGEVESFPVPYYLATLASTPFSDADVPEHAAGVGVDWDTAFMKALGEALERYSAAVYRDPTFETAPTNPVIPARFVQPGDAPDPDAIEYWYPAEQLATDEAVQLPAETVVFPPPERNIRPAITTGLGLGNGGVEALLSGLYEVIERDAAMLSWYSTYDPLGLAVSDDDYATLIARARSENLESTALLLTQDVDVPVVAACVHRNGEWPRFAAGMAADLNPNVAARGALEEAIQNWLELRRMGPEQASEESGAIGPYADFPAEARAFVSPETTIPASSVGPEAVPGGRAELDAVVERVTDAGLTSYGARLTPRDIEGLGFEAVRVVVPEAQPLFTGDSYFGERARTVPEELGFEPRLERAHHPFP
jgi:ribosomal protein S12 methylthiotransferase accessory factor